LLTFQKAREEGEEVGEEEEEGYTESREITIKKTYHLKNISIIVKIMCMLQFACTYGMGKLKYMKYLPLLIQK
jgi:hypothetical protein